MTEQLKSWAVLDAANETRVFLFCKPVFIDGNRIGFIKEFSNRGFKFISQLPGGAGRSRKYWPTAKACERAVGGRFPNATFQEQTK